MDCNEVKIWLNSSSDEELLFPITSIERHLSTCSVCKTKVNAIKQSLYFIENQKEEILSKEKTKALIDNLVSINSKQTLPNITAKFFVSRIAAIFIIVFGLLVGILAGRLLFSDHSGQSDPWSTEFSLLSEYSDYSLFE